MELESLINQILGIFVDSFATLFTDVLGVIVTQLLSLLGLTSP